MDKNFYLKPQNNFKYFCEDSYMRSYLSVTSLVRAFNSQRRVFFPHGKDVYFIRTPLEIAFA